jgi:A/G-specific adenine glycosylase
VPDSAPHRRTLQRALLSWAEAAGRDLPWRRTRDPWAILVAELMLQQTQVSRVVPSYLSFLDRFPSPAACAAAPRAEVVRRWAGLGYNRRAVYLHRAAQRLVRERDGRVPDRLPALLGLPGVGPYTARAVLAFAFERDVAVLDANARRVLARLTGRPVAQQDADRLVPPGAGWAWNQAVLDLGALVCRPRPRCDDCPMGSARACAWRAGVASAADPWRPGPRQGRFEGSNRQGRGRLVDALRRAPVSWSILAVAAGWPGDEARARRVAAALVAEGLAVEAYDGLRLSGDADRSD